MAVVDCTLPQKRLSLFLRKEKKTKHKPIWLLPNAYLSNFLWKSKVHVQTNKENEDLTRCIRTVLYSTRTKECHEWWALQFAKDKSIDHSEHDLVSFQSLIITQCRNVTSSYFYAVKRNWALCLDYYLSVKNYFWAVEARRF